MTTTDGTPLLSLEDLHAAYGPVAALRGLDLVVHPGELVCLLGANGAGKTSTLRAVSGLLSPTRGRIVFDGRPIHGADPRDILAAGIAHCPEGRRVFPHLSVLENLEIGAYVRRDRRAVDEDLERVSAHFPILADRRRQMAGTLSGGEQQMLAIARALMARPRLILFDEPLPMTDHDVPLDLIATPERVIQTRRGCLKPKGILWEELSPAQLAAMPILGRLQPRLLLIRDLAATV